MKYCEKCKVNLTGSPRLCPLCQSVLGNGAGTEEVFPTVPLKSHPHRFFIKMILFATVVAVVICVTVNLSMPTGGWWSLFVIAGAVCMWITFAIVVKKRHNITKNILWQVATISILSLLWDRFTGWRNWSIDYVIPIICAFAMVAMAVVARIMHLKLNDYIIYLIIDAIFGIVPVILILTGNVHVIYPSAICFAVSVISLSALLVFEGESFRAELIRRMHL